MPILKNLVISGGGIHGVSFLGAISYLYDRKLLENVEHYIGTSAGSIISLLLLIGYKPTELYDFCLSFDMNKLINDTNLDNFLEKFGFESSSKLTYVLKRLLNNKNINDKITFSELFLLTKKKITITGVCVNDSNLYLFNHEKTPNMKVLLAVRISCNIPVLFAPVKYDNKLWIDGGAILNYPIEICDNELDNTIGISSYNNTSVENSDITDSFTYLSYLVKCIAFGNAKMTVEKYKNNTIKIQQSNNLLTEIKVEKEEMIHLFTNGYNSACDNNHILKKFIDVVNIIETTKFEKLNYDSDQESQDELLNLDSDQESKDELLNLDSDDKVN